MDAQLLLDVFIILGVMLALLLSGMEIFAALGIGGMVGLFLWGGGPAALETTAGFAWNTVNSWTLTALPLFVFMALLFERSGLSTQAFNVVMNWLGQAKGGLALASIGFGAIFSSISGSSTATAAAIGTLAIPEMEKRNYSPRYLLGALSAGGTLGILIPPSIAMIIYGAMTETSVGRLFIGGIIPGIMLSGLFMLFLWVRAKMNPSLAPYMSGVSWRERFMSLSWLLPVIVVLSAILGGIYFGVVTPTEAAGVGAFSTMILIIAYKRFSFKVLMDSLWGSVRVTSMILLIMVGASILSSALTSFGTGQALARFVDEAGLSPWTLFVAIAFIYLMMGCFLDGISMMIMTIPFFFPLIRKAGLDPVWFGVVLVILIEISLLTPPVGINLFVIQGLVKDRYNFNDVVWGALPFIIIMAMVIVILSLFPHLILWLPSKMIG